MNVEIGNVTRPFGRTPAAAVPVRHRTPRAAGAVPLNAARLLRVELRRNTMPWILPLIAALFWFDSYRPSIGMSPLYELRTWARGTRSSISGRSWPAWPPGWDRGTGAAAWLTW